LRRGAEGLARGLRKNPNDCSIGLRVDYCKSSVLFTGDAEAREEADVPAGPATVLQAGHYGSDTSSSEAFTNAMHPKWVVVPSGKQDEGTNRTYGHPRCSTIERLAALAASAGNKPMRVFQGTSCRDKAPDDWVTIDVSDRALSTARDGDISLVTTGDGEFAAE